MQHPFSNIVIEDHPFYTTAVELDNETQASIPHKRKGPLETSFQNQSQNIADQDIARCIYANGLPFSVFHSPYWKKMLKCVNEAPKGYKGLGYEKIHNTLLEIEVKGAQDAMKPITNSWIETRVSIVSDGWKDSRNHPLVNVIAMSPKGAMFLKSMNCEGQVKDGQFVADIVISAIETVGPRNVVQFITDNAKNY